MSLFRFSRAKEYRDFLVVREQGRIQVDLAGHELEQHERLHNCYPATGH